MGTISSVKHRFTIVSTCPESWGGSEELWSQAVTSLAARGHSISVFKTGVDKTHPRIQALRSLPCAVHDLRELPLPRRWVTIAHFLFFSLHLFMRRPDLVVISQGDNHDGLHFGHLCRKLKLPYTLISQKATDHFWPPDASRAYRRKTYGGAVKCFFVSQHNLSLTEDQNGAPLPHAAIVRNPYLVGADRALPWPGGEAGGLRLACVARLYLLDKGQDILMRVLAREKWKAREVHVSFFGQGINRQGLIDLAGRLGVSRVSFEGQTKDVVGIWKNHHALILPSRTEGLPLSLVEAMMSGRPAIVTKVGGNAEVIEDRVTGFLAAPAEDSIDEALEEAWQRRGDLRRMGELAAIKIRELVPAKPEEEFASTLLEVVNALKTQAGEVGEIQLGEDSADRSRITGVHEEELRVAATAEQIGSNA